MFVAVIPNRKSPPTILLRESYRVGKHVRTRTLANLSSLVPEQLAALRGVLKGETWVRAADVVAVEQSLPHGHVHAILTTMRRIGLDRMLAAKPCRARNIVMGLIAERLLHGTAKLVAMRLWHTTTLAGELAIDDATVNEVYAAMDWLVARQQRIEKKLARQGALQMSLFDQQSPAAITAPDYPGERLVSHRNDPRVRAQLFIGMLAYYVEWHLREALAPLLFDDQKRRDIKPTRDPLAPAAPSPSARRKKTARQTENGWPRHSLATLLEAMGTICKNRYRTGGGDDAARMTLITQPTAWQAEVYRLLGCRQ